ncbi:hypothetical protein BH09BAC6_BH09BAC6_10890 [soil metagenome]|jgi:hypothetical protein
MPRMSDTPQKEVEKLVKKAKAEGCWFYCIATKEWFTPEEFEMHAQATFIMYGDKRPDLFVDFHLSDPKEGIRTRMAYIKKASAELQVFTERVMSYCSFVSKNVNK